MEPTNEPSRRADAVALLVVIIWGVSFTFKKMALDEIDVAPLTCVRYVGMLLLAWTVLLGRRLAGRSIGIGRADWRRVVVAGVLGYTVYIPLSTLGLSLTTPFATTLLMGTSPLFAVLVLARLGVERVTPRHVAGCALAFAGLAVFLSPKLRSAALAAGGGDALVLVGAACFAGYSIASKPLGTTYAFPVVVAHTCAAGAIPVVAATAPAALAFDWSRVSGAGWAALAWTIVVPVYLAWGLWAWAGARAGVGRTSTLMYLVPVIGAVTAWVVLGETFDAAKIGGAVLIVGGLALARRTSGPSAARTDGGPARASASRAVRRSPDTDAPGVSADRRPSGIRA
jgi:drug/metabolite transporter (DMT)-like permease